jgi:hypothetical protein
MNFTGYPGINPEILELLGMGSQTTTAPTTDPTYSSGFDYARSIAGGIPASQMIASGVSYSPEMAGGYTQKDLDMIAAGPAPVMPVAPTQGTPLSIEDQMPYAPVGTPMPTPFMGIPDFIRNLDFSNLPRFEDIQDIRGVENIRPSLFDIDVEEILNNIDTEKFEDIDLSGIDIPSLAPVFPTAPIVQEPVTPAIPQVPIMPRVPVTPEPVIQQPPVRQEVPFVPEIPTIPMNFTALPQMPVIPNIQNLPNQNIDFSQIDYSRIQPNFEMPQITQPIIQPKGGLLGGIGRGISGLQGIQKDFTGFKEDLKNKAANKVLGLFGI